MLKEPRQTKAEVSKHNVFRSIVRHINNFWRLLKKGTKGTRRSIKIASTPGYVGRMCFSFLPPSGKVKDYGSLGIEGLKEMPLQSFLQLPLHEVQIRFVEDGLPAQDLS